MIQKIQSRMFILGAAGILMLVLAHHARPSRPAIPARPVQEEMQNLPLLGKIIFVDAGHGGTDGGARAKDSGRWEKEINLSLALKLKNALEEKGAKTVLSRETDMQYSEHKRSDLTARLDLAEKEGADLLLSIHMNEYRSRKESGPQVFYREGQEKSRLLAAVLQDTLIRRLSPVRERSAMAGNYFILSRPLPSVLIECGFLSNSEEEKKLLDEGYQEKTAQAIAEGVAEYFLLTSGQ